MDYNAIFDQDLSIFELISSNTVVRTARIDFEKNLTTLPPVSMPPISRSNRIVNHLLYIFATSLLAVIAQNPIKSWKDFEINNHPVIGNVDFYIQAPQKMRFYHSENEEI